MAEAQKEDGQVECSKAAHTEPVNFVTLLWEELHEIGKLRRRREWAAVENEKSDANHDKPTGRHKSWGHRDKSNVDREKLDRSTRDTFGDKMEAAKELQEELPADPRDLKDQEAHDKVLAAAHAAELVGLAFSGGGIRSATFNLGVLQGFARYGLLPMFDYLSTVSGGGYIGGWLESWIYRGRTTEGTKEAKDGRAAADQVAQCVEGSALGGSPIRRVQECLKPKRSNKIKHAESLAIRFLREYSNYLTPRMGFLGADTWTAVAIYLRNLILNQTILILFLSFVLLLPYLAVRLTNYLSWTLTSHPWAPLTQSEGILAVLLLLFAFRNIGKNMDQLTGKHRKRESKKSDTNQPEAGSDYTGEFPPSARQSHVLAYVAAPLFMAAWSACAWVLHAKTWCWPAYKWVIGGMIAFFVLWLPVALFGIRDKQQGNGAQDGQKQQTHGGDKSDKPWNAPATRFKSSGFSLISGATGGALLWVAAYQIIRRWASLEGSIWHVVSFGPPLIIIVLLLTMTVQLGLMGILTPDPRREWWGRLGGWLLVMSIGWAAAFALAIYSPLAIMWSKRFAGSASLVWVVNTATGVLGGKSDKTGSLDSATWKDTALSVTPYVFVLGLAAGLATLLEIVLGRLHRPAELANVSLNWHTTGAAASYAQGTLAQTTQGGANTAYVAAHWQMLSVMPTRWLLLDALIVALACLFLARRVDLNEFSMNLFYRNRLVRCYLGASHKLRKPNPFSGFDPDDDFVMSNIRSANGYGGPFPIVNTALNLVTGQNLAWQERKAESFVMTPLHCGFDTWLERLDLDTESEDMAKEGTKILKCGFRPAECYLYPHTTTRAGGFRLGTAISISGAAASPNMGYHSSPALAFLMTCFNVRLGFWAGNPRHETSWMTPGPRFGLFWLIAELFGLSDDEARYVYLSDGGHFENLGLYELVKRRCKYIVVCDADADGDYTFGDLGGAIRKCREDIGVEITLVTDSLKPGTATASDAADGREAGTKENFSETHWAIGKIDYSLVDPKADDGILVYLKTSLTGDEPADVLNYHRAHADFPHQTTADQWFAESQFESYRRLGEHVVEHLFDGLDIEEPNTPGERVKHTTKEIFGMLREFRGSA